MNSQPDIEKAARYLKSDAERLVRQLNAYEYGTSVCCDTAVALLLDDVRESLDLLKAHTVETECLN